jgi:hypothetical protein
MDNRSDRVCGTRNKSELMRDRLKIREIIVIKSEKGPTNYTIFSIACLLLRIKLKRIWRTSKIIYLRDFACVRDPKGHVCRRERAGMRSCASYLITRMFVFAVKELVKAASELEAEEN